MKPWETKTPSHVLAQRESKAKAWRTRWDMKAMEFESIVAEVSQNYFDGAPYQIDGMPTGLAARFEHVIGVNRARGYTLRDWKLSRVVAGMTINETIVAVFERPVVKA